MNTSEIAAILAGVIDPELGIDIVSLGLVYGIRVDDGSVRVEMTMTSPNCPMGDAIASMAAGRLNPAIGDRLLSLEIVTEPEWNVRMADEAALRRLGLLPN